LYEVSCLWENRNLACCARQKACQGNNKRWQQRSGETEMADKIDVLCNDLLPISMIQLRSMPRHSLIEIILQREMRFKELRDEWNMAIKGNKINAFFLRQAKQQYREKLQVFERMERHKCLNCQTHFFPCNKKNVFCSTACCKAFKKKQVK